MENKKYLSLTGLTEYDTLIKSEVAEQNESMLSSAKSYTDEKISDLTSGNSTVAHATNADSAVMAETATKDANGNIIAETYQTKTDEELETNNKTVVGAINEIQMVLNKMNSDIALEVLIDTDSIEPTEFVDENGAIYVL